MQKTYRIVLDILYVFVYNFNIQYNIYMHLLFFIRKIYNNNQ